MLAAELSLLGDLTGASFSCGLTVPVGGWCPTAGDAGDAPPRLSLLGDLASDALGDVGKIYKHEFKSQSKPQIHKTQIQ